jgi:RNA polymerase sigma-70 factor (ECF subfamily)
MSQQRAADSVEAVFREDRGRLLAVLAARFGDLDLAEEVTSEAMEAALQHWPIQGVPEEPLAWLVTTARRRAVDRIRRDRIYAERLAMLRVEIDRAGLVPVAEVGNDVPDERLQLFFTCCHPALPFEAQIALVLRFLAGLSTSEVAQAFLVPVPTMAQRIVRAKRKIRDARIPFRVPGADELPQRLPSVLRVIYLVFTEGYAASEGAMLMRCDLTAEAIRLARILHRLLPGEREVTGLLALLLLVDARRAARVDVMGEPVALENQDRNLWDPDLITEGRQLVIEALSGPAPAPYAVQGRDRGPAR